MSKKMVVLVLVALLLLGSATTLAEATSTASIEGAAGEVDMSEGVPYHPAPLNMEPEAENEYPYMGIAFSMPEALRRMILGNEIFMLADGEVDYGIEPDENGLLLINADEITPEDMRIASGVMELVFVPEAERENMPSMENIEAGKYMDHDAFLTWKESMYSLYKISMLPEGSPAPEGYDETVEMGVFGGYTYYISLDGETQEKPDNADELIALCRELLAQTKITEPRPIDDRFMYPAGPYTEDVSSIGAVDTIDLDGNRVTNDVFKKAKVTMINIFTTWCSPCIAEMPDLAEIAKELGGEDFQLIGIVQDVVDERSGALDPDKLELAQAICEKTGVEYPVLVPDAGMQEGMLKSLLGFPTTYFVDQQGNVIGESYLGSRTKAEWLEVIAEVTAQLEAGK
ncbi:TlpA family protein disulfide reductase [Eubacteriales bacterium OttesenSCG-928-A19]|nr:TlpA family protein disulfide reductase [Eubacteriales bacterium OttesenSCG-928-A19]